MRFTLSPPPEQFEADHPFIYWIFDKKKICLLAGMIRPIEYHNVEKKTSSSQPWNELKKKWWRQYCEFLLKLPASMTFLLSVYLKKCLKADILYVLSKIITEME